MITLVLTVSCTKNNKYHIRARNNYSETLNNVNINTTSYGTVEIGSTTDYKTVENDAITITAISRSGIHLTLRDGVSGNRFAKWTVRFDITGIIHVEQD